MYEITTSYLCKSDTYKKIWCYCGIQKSGMMYLLRWINAERIISSPRLPSENSGTWGTSWPDQAHKCDRWLFFRSLDPFKKGFNKNSKASLRIFKPTPIPERSRNAKAWPEPVIERLVGGQGQPRAAQVRAMHLSDWMRWRQDPPLPRPHLRVGRGIKGISCWRFLPTWGILRVSSSFPSFLHLWLLRLGSFSFAVAEDFATQLLSSHHSITQRISKSTAGESVTIFKSLI